MGQGRKGLSPGSGQVPRAGTGLELTPKASGVENPEGTGGGGEERMEDTPPMPHSLGGLQASIYSRPSSYSGLLGHRSKVNTR